MRNRPGQHNKYKERERVHWTSLTFVTTLASTLTRPCQSMMEPVIDVGQLRGKIKTQPELAKYLERKIILCFAI